MVEHKDRSSWTLNEDHPTFVNDDFDLGMIPIEDLKPELQRERIMAPKPIDTPFEEKFDHTSEGNDWWVAKKKKPANTDALDAWVEAQAKRGSGMRAFVIVIIMLGIILAAGSFFVAQAQAGMTFMIYKVHSVDEDTIVVVDEHGHGFTFYKEGSPDVQVGQSVTVATDMKYHGNNTWSWDRSKTSIIDILED